MEKVIVAGFGGQGVLSLGQMLAYAAMYENMAATWLPSYGPEMRGGTANCSVVLDEKEVASPIIAVPDCLIAMNTPSLFKFQDKVRAGGLVIINSSLISEKCDRITSKPTRSRTKWATTRLPTSSCSAPTSNSPASSPSKSCLTPSPKFLPRSLNSSHRIRLVLRQATTSSEGVIWRIALSEPRSRPLTYEEYAARP